MTYSFPCQAISVAGKQKGLTEGSGTTSSLLWECRRAILEKRPKYLLMENVKALTQKKFIPEFKKWISELESFGYANFWQVLNAKDYGTAQNRERVFMVSILRTEQDLDPFYVFPKGWPLDKCVEDYLEDNVADSYYITNNKITQQVLSDILSQPIVRAELEGRKVVDSNIAQLANIVTTGNFANPERGRVYSVRGCAPCLHTCQGGNLEPKVLIVQRFAVGRSNHGENGDTSNYHINPYFGCITAAQRSNRYPLVAELDADIRLAVRRLTETESLRLMSVPESDIQKMKDAGIAKTNLYKLAGNSIVVSCLYHIFKNIFVTPAGSNAPGRQLTLF